MGGNDPSFFLMKKKGDAMGDLLGLICPVSKFSFKNSSNASCSPRAKG